MVAFPDPRRRHPFHMHDMILGQPAFVEEALQRTAAADRGSFPGRPRRLVLTGCGTSFHAAMYGARVFQEVMPSVPVLAIHAYDLAYGSSVPASATGLGVSHSGSMTTTQRALRRARRPCCRTLAVRGLPDAAMARLAGHTLVLRNHTEQFLHGPFLSIDDREPIVVPRTREDGPRSAAIARALEASGARVVTVGESARAKIRLPAMPRILRPTLSIVPLQFLAYYAALARRANPDIMRTDIARLRAGVEALFH